MDLENLVSVKTKRRNIHLRSPWHTNALTVKALTMMIVLAQVSGCSSSSDGGSNTVNQQPDTTQDSPELLPLPAASRLSSQSLKVRLATVYPETEIEGWACVSTRGLAYVYMFFVEGTVPGFDTTPVGMEVFLDPDNMPDSLDSQIKFIWTEQSVDSILMESPTDGSSVSLNNIRFSEDGQMSAYSSTRGQLYCSDDNGAV